MNILHLKYAVEVAKTRSISKAAENLYMGQPNLSRAIKELEESLGVTIFRRTTKGITTTPDGDEFLRRAQKIVAQVDEMEELYKNGRAEKQIFSVCVPRAGYFALAVSEFARALDYDIPTEIYYKETNSTRTVNSVARGDFNLGVVRYLKYSEKRFSDLFAEKKLIGDTVTEFTAKLLLSENSPLAKKEKITPDDLCGGTEIAHADSPPVCEELKKGGNAIYVYEREAAYELLRSVPGTYAFASPSPPDMLKRMGLVLRELSGSAPLMRDVMIYRRDYRLSEADKMFITEMTKAKRICFGEG